MKSNNPTASVCVITYNHEQYIAQAIDSILVQKTDFDFEVVIGEDCSTDATRSILEGYQARYPGKVRVLARPRNLGIMNNLRDTLLACTGSYVALLEGDDYWTDENKLALQVAALAANARLALCIHDAEAFVEGADEASLIFYGKPMDKNYLFSEKFAAIYQGNETRVFTHHDIVHKGWFMATASMVFRRSALPVPFPEWFSGVFSGDYSLQLLLSLKGDVLYLPRVMSRYRIHAGGVVQSTDKSLHQNDKRLFENKAFVNLVSAELRPVFADRLRNYYLERQDYYFGLSTEMASKGNRVKQLYYYAKAISVNRERLKFHAKRIAKRLV